MPEKPASPSSNAPAIVVGGVAYGDRSRVVRLLTQTHGLVPLWVANANSQKALWHPMALLEVLDLRPGKGGGLWTARECRRAEPQIAYRREPSQLVLHKVKGVLPAAGGKAETTPLCAYVGHLMKLKAWMDDTVPPDPSAINGLVVRRLRAPQEIGRFY